MCGGSCMKSCWSGHNYVWLRIILGVLLLTFVFSAGVMIGRIGSYGRSHRSNMMYRGGGGYGMMVSLPTTAPATTTK